MDATVTRSLYDSHTVPLRSGRRLGVAEFGDAHGMPLLAFHGAPASRLMFDIADEAARQAGIRLIAFDRPGYGLSPLDYGATLQSRTDVFSELPDALGLDRFAIFGVSGGAPYATALAARLGTRVTALALASPMGPVADVAARSAVNPAHLSMSHRTFFLDLPRHPWILRANAEIAVRSFRIAPRMLVSAFQHLLPQSDRDIFMREDVLHSMIAMTMEATRHGILGGIADLEIFGEPWNVDYTAITAPARMWQGTADTIVPASVSLRLAKLIPNCEVTTVSGAGHFWIYNAIPEILAAVKALAG